MRYQPTNHSTVPRGQRTVTFDWCDRQKTSDKWATQLLRTTGGYSVEIDDSIDSTTVILTFLLGLLRTAIGVKTSEVTIERTAMTTVASG